MNKLHKCKYSLIIYFNIIGFLALSITKIANSNHFQSIFLIIAYNIPYPNKLSLEKSNNNTKVGRSTCDISFRNYCLRGSYSSTILLSKMCSAQNSDRVGKNLYTILKIELASNYIFSLSNLLFKNPK